MQIDAIALTLRPRSMWEGCDLGVRLLHFRMRSVYACYLVVAVPTFLLCLATYPLEPWLPALAVWLAKPWLDHTILFALSRALFAEPTGPRDLWAERGRILRPNLLGLVLLRLSASRSFVAVSRSFFNRSASPFSTSRSVASCCSWIRS